MTWSSQESCLISFSSARVELEEKMPPVIQKSRLVSHIKSASTPICLQTDTWEINFCCLQAIQTMAFCCSILKMAAWEEKPILKARHGSPCYFPGVTGHGDSIAEHAMLHL